MSDYVYDLKVEQASAEELDAIEKAIKNMDELSGCVARLTTGSNFFSSLAKGNASGAVSYLYEDNLKNDLSALSKAFPNAVFTMSVSDYDDSSKWFELEYHADQLTRREAFVEVREVTEDIPSDKHPELIEQERTQTVRRMVNNLCENTDFDLLDAQKNAILHAQRHGTPVPSQVLDGLVNLMDQLCDLGEALGRFQYPGIEPPFPLLPYYVKKDIVIEPEEEPKMYVFCEEHEGSDAIREFTIHAISRHEDELQKLLQAKVEQDPYGIIAKNGENDYGLNHFSSNFEERVGIVEYYIVEESVLNKEQIQALLNSREYDTRFVCPNNLRDILKDTVSDYVQRKDIAGVDVEKATDYIMSNKKFHAMVKDEYWSHWDNIPDNRRDMVNRDIARFLREAVDEDPNLFETMEAIQIIKYPDNLKEILIDNIYEVSRELNLPVSNADEKAVELMRGVAFTEQFKHLDGVDHLSEDSDAYQEAQWGCYDFMSEELGKTKEHEPLAEMLAHARSQRPGNTQNRAGKTPDIERE